MSNVSICRDGLYQLAKSQSCCSVPQHEYEHWEQEYREFFTPGPAASDAVRLLFESRLKLARELYEASAGSLIYQCQQLARKQSAPNSPCSENKVRYPLDSVLMAVLLARIMGWDTADEIASFYQVFNLDLHYLIPGLPSPRHCISPASVKAVMQMFSDKEISELLQLYLARPCLKLAQAAQLEAVRFKQEDEPHGKSSSALPQGGEACSAKKKSAACLSLLPRLYIVGSLVMTDALNEAADLSKALRRHHADYLLCLEHNGGSRDLLSCVEAAFAQQEALSENEILYLIKSEKDYGRLHTTTIAVLPASALNSRIKIPYADLNCLVKYTEECECLDGSRSVNSARQARYFGCSLPCCQDSAVQIMRSAAEYEAGVEQRRVLGCRDDSTSASAGLNKTARKFFTWFRPVLSEQFSALRQRLNKPALKRLPSYSVVQHELQCMHPALVMHKLLEFSLSNSNPELESSKA